MRSEDMNNANFESLLSQLTLEEKVSLLSGKDFRNIGGVSRLGIPPLKVLSWLHRPTLEA